MHFQKEPTSTINGNKQKANTCHSNRNSNTQIAKTGTHDETEKKLIVRFR